MRAYSLGMDIVSFIAVMTMIIPLAIKKRKSELQTYPIWVLLFIGAFILSDGIYCILCSLGADYSIALFYVKSVYFILNSAIVLEWGLLVYKYGSARSRKQFWTKYLYWTVFAANCAFVIINLFVPFVFRIESNEFVVAPAGMIVFTILNFLSFIISDASLIKGRRNINPLTYYFLAGFPVPALLGEILQMVIREQSFIALYSISGLLILVYSCITYLFTDELTGLSSRKYLLDKLDNWYSRKEQLNIYLLMVSVNNIDALNKKYGTEYGDRVLKATAKIINEAVAGLAIAFRAEGNEFAVVYTSKGDAGYILGIIKNTIEDRRIDFNKPLEPDRRISLAMGSYATTNREGNTMELMRRIYLKTTEKADEVERLIDDALEKHRFMVYFQPIFDNKSQKFKNAEALLRYVDLSGNFVSPQLIIETAERTDRIFKITKYVLEEVCRFISTHDMQKLGLETIEMNLSTKDLTKTDIDTELMGIIDRYGIPHEMINFELTETFYSLIDDNTLNKLYLITEQGCGISLDDYGAGYSNLTRLAQLPLKFVKIDRSLTSQIDNPKINSILKNVIPMLKELDLDIIVEGVETTDEQAKVTRFGISLIQGYLFSRPLSQDKFIEFMKNNK